MRAILLLLALGLAAGCDRQKASTRQGDGPVVEAGTEASSAQQKGVDRSHAGETAPDIKFKNPDGGEIALSAFKGVPTLINLWATWCAPCVKELPTLDKLAEAYLVDGELGVVTISQDMGPQGSVRAFLDTLGVKNLGAFHDDKMALAAGLKTDILPTTILYGADGREIWRYVGDLDWTSAEARALLSEANSRRAGSDERG